ncbi:hypothetical protein [Acetobacter sp.]|uniref:hypothetical protein n=1 Tax=Acetobacter sp. TaxID=440 RepID=UPI0039E77195
MMVPEPVTVIAPALRMVVFMPVPVRVLMLMVVRMGLVGPARVMARMVVVVVAPCMGCGGGGALWVWLVHGCGWPCVPCWTYCMARTSS